eukprot:SAG31_NODE_978_length_10615_cov_4.488208_7_plen_325_part_00
MVTGTRIADSKESSIAVIGGRVDGGGGKPSAWQLDTDAAGGWLTAEPFLFISSANFTCEFDIHVKRKPVMFMVKELSVDFLVAFAGLLALFIDFTIPPQLGGRSGVLMTAMLMTINKAVKRDLGLGSLDYLLYVDMIGVINTLVLAGGILLTVVVYTIHYNGRSNLAKSIDRAFSRGYMVLFCAYVIGFLLLLSTQNTTAVLIYTILVLLLVSVCVVATIVWHRRQKMRLYQSVAKEVHTAADHGQEAWLASIERAFHMFDHDNDGILKWEEASALLVAMYPELKESSVMSNLVSELGLNVVAGVVSTVMRMPFDFVSLSPLRE